MIDEGYVKSLPPIKLTKTHSEKIEVPRDDFKVYITQNSVDNWHCMRYVKTDNAEYAVTYWNCPNEPAVDEKGPHYIYKCSECEVVTWIEVEV